jgi:HD-GYP domain-containing protein (c-di-GMP phosphodiesterase class II)
MVSIDSVSPGAVLGKSILGDGGSALLKENTVLTSRYIKRLKKIGILRCYVEDKISEGIVLPPLINDQLRFGAIETVGDFYNEVARNHHSPFNNWGKMAGLVNGILDEMLTEDELVCDMMDLKTFDNYTFSHCVSVAFLSVVMGIAMGLKRQELYHLAVGALMHDVGKMFIPIEIINKPEGLTDEEFACIQTHSIKGYEYLKETGEISDRVCKGVLYHHERIDGIGYPDRIDGKQIGLFGKIYAICDVYDAITSDRPYRKAWSIHEGVEYIMANGNIRFDTELVDVFLRNVVPYPIGTILRLSNGFKAIVVKDNKNISSRPSIRIFEEEGQLVKPYIVHLATDRDFLNVTIMETLEI